MKRVVRGVDRVQSRPFEADVRGASAEMFRWLAPEMPFAKRLAMANVWLY